MRSYQRLCALAPAVLATALLVLLLSTSTVAVGEPTRDAAAPLLRPVHIASVEDYLQTVNARGTPLLLVIFDQTDTRNVETVWSPLVQQLAANLGTLSIGVAYATAASDIGEMLLSQLLSDQSSRNALLFYDAIITATNGDQTSFAKIPKTYRGTLNSERIMRWSLQSISSEAIERIDNEADLAYLLALYPGFPEIARVLYFTDEDVMGPVYKVVSQQLIGDAVFGVIQHPFATPELSALAKRYNVTSLPAICVLHADPDHTDADLVQWLPDVTADTTVEQLTAALVNVLPHSASQAIAKAQQSKDESLLQYVHQRKVHVVLEMDRAHKETIAAVRDAELTQPELITSQKDWEELCGDLRPRHACLVAVAANKEGIAPVAAQLHSAALRLFQTFSDTIPAWTHRVVLDASVSADLVAFLGAGANGFPDVVVMEHRPGGMHVYHNFAGRFAPERLANFFATALTNPTGGTTYDPRNLPLFSRAEDTGDDGDL